MLTLNILWLTTSNYSSPSAHKNKRYYHINLLSSGLCFQFSSLSINKSNFYYFLDNQMRTLSIFKNLCNLYNWINGYINQLLQATNQNQPFRPPLNAEKYFLKYRYIYLLSAFSSPHRQHYLFFPICSSASPSPSLKALQFGFTAWDSISNKMYLPYWDHHFIYAYRHIEQVRNPNNKSFAKL